MTSHQSAKSDNEARILLYTPNVQSQKSASTKPAAQKPVEQKPAVQKPAVQNL